MGSNKFEWDERKNRTNQNKHLVDFNDVTDVFDDDKRLIDATIRNGERRYLTIGKAFDLILTVIYTMRKFTIRIISARPSRKEERKRYLTQSLTKQDEDYDEAD